MYVTVGNAATKIGKYLKGYRPGCLVSVDNVVHNDCDYNIVVDKQQHVEDYENRSNITFPEQVLKNFLTAEHVYVITGAGSVSGLLLKLCEKLYTQNKSIHILYIKPDTEFLTRELKLHERVLSNVIQEFALSGKFEKVTLFSNKQILHHLTNNQKISFANLFDQINKTIAWFYANYLTYLRNEKSFGISLEDVDEVARIETIGGYDVLTDNLKLFYSLVLPRKKHFFLIDKEVNVNKVLNNIRNNVEQLGETTYSIHNITSNIEKTLCVVRTTVIESYI